MPDLVPQLDAEALALFARKGLEAGPDAPQVGEGNAVKVRRVLQLTADLGGPLSELRILDLGCGEGVYAIEAGLWGAQVVAVDARDERMQHGVACAERHRLDNVAFRREDVRSIRPETYGDFDVVYCLGLLYHLDATDALALLATVRKLCRRLLVVDTLVTLESEGEVEGYEGRRVREHEDDDSEGVRRSRLLRSIDNTFAFHFTRDSLVRAVRDAGFSSVLECHVPREPGKRPDRITLAALTGEPVSVATYPWLNELSEPEIEERLRRS